MGTIFDSAAAALRAATVGVAGVPITYTRGTSSTGTIYAVPAKTQLQVDDMIAGRIEMESHDFVVPSSMLTISGVSLFPPQEGDRIVSGGVTFEVMNPPYRGSDNSPVNPVLVRIHTKRAS